jgi:hypothetical protein
MEKFLIDEQEAYVDDQDLPRVLEYTWHLRNGVPRAKIFLEPLLPPPGVTAVAARKLPAYIPLGRFIFKITAHPNVCIRHWLNNPLDCQRRTMYVEARNKTKPMFLGTEFRADGWYSLVWDGLDLYTDGPFASQWDAARSHDKQALQLFGWHAKTNFYPQL